MVEYGRQRRDEGSSLYRISLEVGVPEPTLGRWLQQWSPSTALLPVRIKPEDPRIVNTAGLGERGPVIITPRGWRVEGLCVGDIAALLQVAS